MLPGSDEEPEEAAIEHEVRLLTGKLLSQSPNAWRHAVLLVHVDDVPLRKGAVRLDTDETTSSRPHGGRGTMVISATSAAMAMLTPPSS